MALINDTIDEAPQAYTLTGLDGKPMQVTEDQLSGMDHATLYNLRSRNQDPAMQALLAPYEHRAFARQATQENPLMSAPIAVATPLYAGAKALGIAGRADPGTPTTPPTMRQVGQGLLGVGEGLVGAARGAIGRLR
jgi:hypothetical protein